MESLSDPMAVAGAATVREATDITHAKGQANIASSGLGPRWVRSFKQRFYLNDGLDAAGIVYSTINFSVVFERGATVKGNPTLWIPLPTTPLKIGGKRVTAKRISDEVGQLFKIELRGKEYLAMKIAVSKRVATGPLPRMSTAMLKRAAKKPRKGQVTRLIPMFVAASSIRIRDRLRIREIAEETAANMPEMYADKVKT
jgi:hypothetical protein